MVTEDRIQSLVCGIVGETLSPQTPGQNGESEQFSSAENDINNRFCLPCKYDC